MLGELWILLEPVLETIESPQCTDLIIWHHLAVLPKRQWYHVMPI